MLSLVFASSIGENLGTILFLGFIMGLLGIWLVEPYSQLEKWGKRLAVGVGLMSALYHAVTSNDSHIGAYLFAAILGILTGGFSLGFIWIVLGSMGRLRDLYQEITCGWKNFRQRRKNAKEARRLERQRQREQREWERAAPKREREAKDSRQRQLAESQAKEQSDAQREDARAACELLYSLHEPDIKDRYTREQYDLFVSKFMGDDKPLATVRKRASELQQLIQRHYETLHPPEKFSSLTEVTKWFEERKREIEALPIDDLFRNEYLVRLNECYGELTARVMESMEP